MLVHELIGKLVLCNPAAVVVVRGYEFGVNDINSIQRTKVILDVPGDREYGGSHELSDTDGVACVYLSSCLLIKGV